MRLSSFKSITAAACLCFFFFFNDTATTEIYTLSLHDALPISRLRVAPRCVGPARRRDGRRAYHRVRCPVLGRQLPRSEEHTSELQSPCNLVCRLLLEKKKNRRLTKINHGHRGTKQYVLVSNGH